MENVCLVTGASRGIGLAVCEALKSRGHTVCRCMRTPDEGAYRLDVTDRASIDLAIAQIVADHGRIDVLVNNVGSATVTTVEIASEEEVQREFDVNLFGMVRVTQSVLPHMRAQQSGRIINIGSLAGVRANAGIPFYCAAKYAVEGLTMSLAISLRRFNIYVSVVDPGFVRSGFAEQLSHAERMAGEHPYKAELESYEERFRRGVASGQNPSEVAETVLSVMDAAKPNIRYATSELGQKTLDRVCVDPTGNREVEMQLESWLSPFNEEE